MTPHPPPPSGFSDRGSVTGAGVTAGDGTLPGVCHPPGPDPIGFPSSGDGCDGSFLVLGEKEQGGFSLSLVGPAPFPTDPPPFIDYGLRMRRLDWWSDYVPRVRRRAGGRCERCSRKTRRLEVHHLTYERFGRELLTDLQALCKPCHDIADEERKRWTRIRHYGGGDGGETEWCEKKFGDDPRLWPDDAADQFLVWLEEKEERDATCAAFGH